MAIMMTPATKRMTVFGVFSTREAVKDAIDRMTREGLPGANIQVLFPDNRESRAFAQDNATTPPQGTDTGRTADEDLDGSLGLDRPSIGPTRGALPQALRDMAIPEDDAISYGDRVKNGEILLAVKCRNETDVERAFDVLNTTGGTMVGSS